MIGFWPRYTLDTEYCRPLRLLLWSLMLDRFQKPGSDNFEPAKDLQGREMSQPSRSLFRP
jgi:hypothetical protein